MEQDAQALAQAVAATGRPCAAGIIDHGLQVESAAVAARAAAEADQEEAQEARRPQACHSAGRESLVGLPQAIQHDE